MYQTHTHNREEMHRETGTTQMSSEYSTLLQKRLQILRKKWLPDGTTGNVENLCKAEANQYKLCSRNKNKQSSDSFTQYNSYTTKPTPFCSPKEQFNIKKNRSVCTVQIQTEKANYNFSKNVDISNGVKPPKTQDTNTFKSNALSELYKLYVSNTRGETKTVDTAQMCSKDVIGNANVNSADMHDYNFKNTATPHNYLSGSQKMGRKIYNHNNVNLTSEKQVEKKDSYTSGSYSPAGSVELDDSHTELENQTLQDEAKDSLTRLKITTHEHHNSVTADMSKEHASQHTDTSTATENHSILHDWKGKKFITNEISSSTPEESLTISKRNMLGTNTTATNALRYKPPKVTFNPSTSYLQENEVKSPRRMETVATDMLPSFYKTKNLRDHHLKTQSRDDFTYCKELYSKFHKLFGKAESRVQLKTSTTQRQRKSSLQLCENSRIKSSPSHYPVHQHSYGFSGFQKSKNQSSMKSQEPEKYDIFGANIQVSQCKLAPRPGNVRKHYPKSSLLQRAHVS